ncbi:hypothetical protein MLD52_01615 [Puniceicoccaceae bacterium K14]|nr:hypothetical protein [Puniceicoccaceae bacterium K14]
MRTREIVSLGIGRDYVRCAVACLKSCRNQISDDVSFRLYYGNADPSVFEIPDWLELECIDNLIFQKLTRQDLSMRPTFAREFKHVPLTHPASRESDVLFLDADVYAFGNPFDDFFKKIEDGSAILFAKDKKAFPIYRNLRHEFDLNLVEEGNRLGYTLSNLSPNTGVMGRAADEYGWAFADRAAELMAKRILTPFPDTDYFNDEPYFSVAFQLEVSGKGRGFIDISTKDYIHTHKKGVLKNQDSDAPSVYWGQQDVLHEKPKLIHFIGFRQFPCYLSRVERDVPFVSSGERYS